MSDITAELVAEELKHQLLPVPLGGPADPARSNCELDIETCGCRADSLPRAL